RPLWGGSSTACAPPVSVRSRPSWSARWSWPNSRSWMRWPISALHRSIDASTSRTRSARKLTACPQASHPIAEALSDQALMARAIRLAERGLYTTEPNPRVGCVLVRDGRIVGEGWHVRAGEGHAEVNALRQAGELARGAAAYVTLEPCSHFGKTPPCADALVAAGVSRVVAAMQDPNPQVAGRGLQRLREAGVEV